MASEFTYNVHGCVHCANIHYFQTETMLPNNHVISLEKLNDVKILNFYVNRTMIGQFLCQRYT